MRTKNKKTHQIFERSASTAISTCNLVDTRKNRPSTSADRAGLRMQKHVVEGVLDEWSASRKQSCVGVYRDNFRIARNSSGRGQVSSLLFHRDAQCSARFFHKRIVAIDG
jgi:hypothetical protein